MKILLFALVIAGIALMAIPLWIAFWSAVGVAVPWLFFGLLAWMFLSIGRRRREPRWWRARQAYRSRYAAPPPPFHPAPPASSAPNPAPPPTPPRPAPRPTSDLPASAQALVDRIRGKAELLLAYSSRFPSYSQDLYLVRQTATEYLPRTIQAYLAVPPDRREQVMISTGKTPLQELNEQLELLDQKLNDIAEAVELRDLDRLLANRRFLEQRFGPVIRA